MKLHLAAVLLGGLVIVSGAVSVEAQIVLRLGHNNAVSHPQHLGSLELAKRVEERSGGKLKIQVYPAAQLGDERELGEGMRIGTIALMVGQVPQLGAFLPALGALEGGYLFRNRAHLEATVNGAVGKELSSRLSKAAGISVVGWYFAGERILTTASKPVNVPGDLKGMKVRVPRLANYIATFQALGAEPVPIAFNETYLALKTGLADGQENPVPSIYAMKFYEVQKYLNYIGHIYGVGQISVSDRAIAALPIELRAILLNETSNVGPFIADLYDKQSQELLPTLMQSMIEVRPDREPFRQAALKGGMEKWFTENLGVDLYQRVKEIK